MVTASLAFNWRPEILQGDNLDDLQPNYRVSEEVVSQTVLVRTRFADLPSFGIWVDRSETDEELLEELGGNWHDFGLQR